MLSATSTQMMFYLVAIALRLLAFQQLAVCGEVAAETVVANCYIGEYAVTKPPFGKCSGFRPCEPGFYCVGGARHPCPPGFFGNIPRLNSSVCSGPCPPGFFCPVQSTEFAAHPCGNASLYCPPGSSEPRPVPPGYYSINPDGGDNELGQTTRSAVSICPLGHYCVEGRRFPCPGGTYGDVSGLSSAACSGPCPAGFFCPPGSLRPFDFPCSSDPVTYCPEASPHPQPVGLGFFATASQSSRGGGFASQAACPPGSFCRHGERFPCPAGRYGLRTHEVDPQCSGACRAGYFCPPGSVVSTAQACPGRATYCPAGSAAPQPVQPGYYTQASARNLSAGRSEAAPPVLFLLHDNVRGGIAAAAQGVCPPGSYCRGGERFPCPAGRYGAGAGLQTAACSGACAPGYFCPEGATSPRAQACGGPDRFCPPGAAVPQPVHPGYYSVRGDDEAEEDDARHADTRDAERLCPAGYYCVRGVRARCRPGHFGDRAGQTQATCAGRCAAGYYCPAGSTSAEEVPCGDPARFCPPGSAAPVAAGPGQYTAGGGPQTRWAQRPAPPGAFAVAGLRMPCPAGVFGAEAGLASPQCSGRCRTPGFACPAGSTSPVMRACGGDDVFCPAGTAAPLAVPPGFYTADYTREACPPGSWRNTTQADTWGQGWAWGLNMSREGEVNLAEDAEGYVNLAGFNLSADGYVNLSGAGSFSGLGPWAVVQAAGPSPCQRCPAGTFKAVAGDALAQCRPCEMHTSTSSPDGASCTCLAVLPPDRAAWFNFTSGRCQAVAPAALPRLAEAQEAAAWAQTSRTRSAMRPCPRGAFCQRGEAFPCPAGRYGDRPRETRATCAGACTAGFFCPPGSTSSTAQACGAADRVCPPGSAAPRPVPRGFFSAEEAREDRRAAMRVCPRGYYCAGDGRRRVCPPGRYAHRAGQARAACAGPCVRGHFCPAGSASPRPAVCGNASVYCPEGAAAPTPVTDGFYSVATGHDAGAVALWAARNDTQSAELPCEPGYYCQGGVKRPCPPGTFGWRYGMTSPACGGQCAPGFYCPSYLPPQPDAPAHTVWPGRPHTVANELPCGDGNYYCPRGSAFPRRVSGGHYSVGGNRDNRTRSAQALCPPGSYCVDAVAILCPPGRYGNQPGLTVSQCSGGCPAGFYCPAGTVDPLPCPQNTYSTGRAPLCSPCAGTRTTPMPCFDDNTCCLRG